MAPSGHKAKIQVGLFSHAHAAAVAFQRIRAAAKYKVTQVSVRQFAPSALVCFAVQVKTQIQSKVAAHRARPNPSIERTRNGRPHLAFISFWAKRVLPLRAAHVKR